MSFNNLLFVHLIVGTFVLIFIAITCAIIAYRNLTSDDLKINFYKLMSANYLKAVVDQQRLHRLTTVKKWYTFLVVTSALFFLVTLILVLTKMKMN